MRKLKRRSMLSNKYSISVIKPVPVPTPAKNISNINDKLSTLLKNSKINQKLNPVVSKPIE